MSFTLHKYEKLCSRAAIDELFRTGNSAVAYPLRAVFTIKNDGNKASRFFISIPKKKIRTAVQRVLLRRRTREAYRLNRELLAPIASVDGRTVDIAFLYMDKEIADYATIELKMKTLLKRIADSGIEIR